MQREHHGRRRIAVAMRRPLDGVVLHRAVDVAAEGLHVRLARIERIGQPQPEIRRLHRPLLGVE